MSKLMLIIGVIFATVPTSVMATGPTDPTYAWVAFDAQALLDSGASGLADRANGRRLTVRDPVRIASISKLVVALGVMRLVEQRRLDLDEDVSRYLGWRFRNPAFDNQPISLRLLLSHRSGLKDASDEAPVVMGQGLRTRLRQRATFDSSHAAGTFFRYSNLNFVVVAAIMEGASGERFDRLMTRLVLSPLKLKACYGWQVCTATELAAGVTLYGVDGKVRADGLVDWIRPCPQVPVRAVCRSGHYRLRHDSARFSPQGGLRISMEDLARIGQLFLTNGRTRDYQFLSKASLDEMVGPQWKFNGTNGDTSDAFFCAYGLGVQSIPSDFPGCRDQLFKDGRRAIGHPGEAYGLVSGLWIDRSAGKGIAFFSANESGDRRHTSSSFFEVERMLAANLDK